MSLHGKGTRSHYSTLNTNYRCKLSLHGTFCTRVKISVAKERGKSIGRGTAKAETLLRIVFLAGPMEILRWMEMSRLVIYIEYSPSSLSPLVLSVGVGRPPFGAHGYKQRFLLGPTSVCPQRIQITLIEMFHQACSTQRTP